MNFRANFNNSLFTIIGVLGDALSNHCLLAALTCDLIGTWDDLDVGLCTIRCQLSFLLFLSIFYLLFKHLLVKLNLFIVHAI